MDKTTKEKNLKDGICDAAVGSSVIGIACSELMSGLIAIFGEQKFKDVILPEMLERASDKTDRYRDTKDSLRKALDKIFSEKSV